MNLLRQGIVASIAQTIVGSLLVFELYRYANQAVGLEAFGLWSLLMATVSTARLAEFGLGGAVTKYVAEAEAKGQRSRVAELVDSALVTSAVSVSIVIVITALPLSRGVGGIVEPHNRETAVALLPLAAASLWLTSVCTTLLSALDGMKMIVHRNLISLGGQALLLIFAYVFVPRFGIVGLAWAQVLQAIAQLVTARVVFRGVCKESYLLPSRWTLGAVKSMLNYGLNVQVQQVFQVLSDPAAKVLFAVFGGSVAVAHFEVASRVVQYCRNLIVGANKAIVPFVASLSGAVSKDTLRVLYLKNMKVVIVTSMPLFLLLALFTATGVLDKILLGEGSSDFRFVVYVLCVAWAVNTLSAPAYFLNMGTNGIALNTASHAISAIASAAGSYAFGMLYGKGGVTIGYAVGVIVGAVFLIATASRNAALIGSVEKGP